jgi:hypothetical protein
MTWLSFSTKVLSLTIILPLILTQFSTSEITVWYLFSTFIGLQFIFDLGFSASFSRVISYAFGGSEKVDHLEIDTLSIQSPRWTRINKLIGTMGKIYFLLALVYIVILLTVGSYAMKYPISQIKEPLRANIAWIIIVINSGATFFGNVYKVYLQGVNKIALLRRWEMIVSLGSIITSFVILMNWSNLLILVIGNQLWIFMHIIINRYLARNIYNGKFSTINLFRLDKKTLNDIWPSTWRSGIGILMSHGVLQISGIIYSNIGSAKDVASYLLALRLMQNIKSVAMAPFYSKLPLLAQLRAKGKFNKQLEIAKRGMNYSYWAFLIPFIIIGLYADHFLRFINSNADFVGPLFWGTLGLGYFLERYGAMHLHLYSTSGKIIWHIANGISGMIYIIVIFLLFNKLDIFVIPVAFLLSMLLFYSWYSASHSYRLFRVNFLNFEKSAVLAPSVLMLVFLFYYIILYQY